MSFHKFTEDNVFPVGQANNSNKGNTWEISQVDHARKASSFHSIYGFGFREENSYFQRIICRRTNSSNARILSLYKMLISEVEELLLNFDQKLDG